ncbi:MAG: hypothetical protein J6N53_14710 [Lachnospiraceae bacterium]|nr:hypothetical protein [Lachnospiraceae bacterium]
MGNSETKIEGPTKKGSKKKDSKKKDFFVGISFGFIIAVPIIYGSYEIIKGAVYKDISLMIIGVAYILAGLFFFYIDAKHIHSTQSNAIKFKTTKFAYSEEYQTYIDIENPDNNNGIKSYTAWRKHIVDKLKNEKYEIDICLARRLRVVETYIDTTKTVLIPFIIVVLSIPISDYTLNQNNEEKQVILSAPIYDYVVSKNTDDNQMVLSMPVYDQAMEQDGVEKQVVISVPASGFSRNRNSMEDKIELSISMSDFLINQDEDGVLGAVKSVTPMIPPLVIVFFMVSILIDILKYEKERGFILDMRDIIAGMKGDTGKDTSEK